jgi:hypothetical protein
MAKQASAAKRTQLNHISPASWQAQRAAIVPESDVSSNKS